MMCLLPMAYISFKFLDITSGITGGLITDVAGAANLIPGMMGELLMFVVGAILGVVLIVLVPVHWALIYHPGDVMLLLGLIVPWILCCVITSGLFAHSPRGGFNSSIAIGIGYFFVMLLPYIVLQIIAGGAYAVLLEGVASGLTDLPYIAAIGLATMEGAAIGGVFGAFIGSLKYEPEGSDKKKKKSKSKSKSKKKKKEPTLGGSSSSSSYGGRKCKNCGAQIPKGDDFCTNCGSKFKG